MSLHAAQSALIETAEDLELAAEMHENAERMRKRLRADYFSAPFR
jgi:hypothetical protein